MKTQKYLGNDIANTACIAVKFGDFRLKNDSEILPCGPHYLWPLPPPPGIATRSPPYSPQGPECPALSLMSSSPHILSAPWVGTHALSSFTRTSSTLTNPHINLVLAWLLTVNPPFLLFRLPFDIKLLFILQDSVQPAFPIAVFWNTHGQNVVAVKQWPSILRYRSESPGIIF